MKKSVKICIAALLCVATSCNDDFMERYPLSSLSPDTYFQTEAELKAYTNAFYNQLPAYQSLVDFSPDDFSARSLPDFLRGDRVVPASGGGWSWTFLRRINFMLDNSHRCTDEKIRAKYDGLALFFRTWFYFDKIVTFGDVPWYDHVLETTDEEGLNKARDPRELVFSHMLEDIDYAIEHLPTGRNAQTITKWTALAFKSRMCLWEGAFRKYHGLTGWEDIMRECVKASDALIANSGYRVYTSTKDKAYQDLFLSNDANPDEVILARYHDKKLNWSHNLHADVFGDGYVNKGVNRSVINSYLKTDGTRFTDNPNYLTMQWYEEMQDRDPRLSQTIRTPGFKPFGFEGAPGGFANTVTGYVCIKYLVDVPNILTPCFNAFSIFRYAEVLLNYAEAKAELGEITQADIDKTIKLLRDRVGMPNLIVANANSTPDPYLADQYRRVTGANKGIILEIRRERRVELVYENFRISDIFRWKEGHLFTRDWNGMYFPGAGEYDMDHDGVIETVIYEDDLPSPQNPNRRYLKLGKDIILENGAAGGQIITNYGTVKTFDEKKDYLSPIPLQDLQLNPNLTQNPEWASQ